MSMQVSSETTKCVLKFTISKLQMMFVCLSIVLSRSWQVCCSKILRAVMSTSPWSDTWILYRKIKFKPRHSSNFLSTWHLHEARFEVGDEDEGILKFDLFTSLLRLKVVEFLRKFSSFVCESFHKILLLCFAFNFATRKLWWFAWNLILEVIK